MPILFGNRLKVFPIGLRSSVPQEQMTRGLPWFPCCIDFFMGWLIKIFFNVYLFLTERETERQSMSGEGQRERETQNPKPAPGSELSVQNPTWGLNSQTTRSWPEPKSDAPLTGPPRHPKTLLSLQRSLRNHGNKTNMFLIGLTP